MIPAELACLRALCDAATPGPWSAILLNDGTDASYVEGPEFVSARSSLSKTETSQVQWRIHIDAAFIAAARSAVPALLDEVEALKAELADTKMKLALEESSHTQTIEKDDAKLGTLTAALGQAEETLDRGAAYLCEHAGDTRDLGLDRHAKDAEQFADQMRGIGASIRAALKAVSQ